MNDVCKHTACREVLKLPASWWPLYVHVTPNLTSCPPFALSLVQATSILPSPGLGQNLPTACSTLFSCPLQSNIHMAVGVDLLTCESWYVFSPVKSLQRIRIVTRVHSTSFKVRQALAQEPLKSSPSCSALLGTLAPPNLLTSPLTGHCPPLRHSPACAHCLECSTPRSLHGWFFPIPKRPSLSLSPLAFLFSLWAYH